MARPTRAESAERERVYREMYDRGATCSEIARHVGVSVSAVAQWFRRNNLTPHGEGNKPHAERPGPTEDRAPVPSAPGYTVTRSGRVYSERTDPPREMTPRVHNGQLRVAVSVSGRVRYRYAAELVLEVYGEPRPEGAVIGFCNGNKLDPAIGNLEWRHSRAKIDLAELVRVWQSSASVREVCERMAVSYPTVHSNVSRLRERGVPLKMMRAEDGIDDLIRIAEELE